MLGAIIILALAAAVLGVHLWMSTRIWRNPSPSLALLRFAGSSLAWRFSSHLPLLAGLSLVTSALWALGGLLIGTSSSTPGLLSRLAEQAYTWTFGLVWRLWELVPQLSPGGDAFRGIFLPYLVTLLFFFLLSLLPALFVQRQTQLRSHR